MSEIDDLKRKLAASEASRERLTKALNDLVIAWDRFGPNLATVSGRPNTLERAKAAIAAERTAAKE